MDYSVPEQLLYGILMPYPDMWSCKETDRSDHRLLKMCASVCQQSPKPYWSEDRETVLTWQASSQSLHTVLKKKKKKLRDLWEIDMVFSWQSRMFRTDGPCSRRYSFEAEVETVKQALIFFLDGNISKGTLACSPVVDVVKLKYLLSKHKFRGLLKWEPGGFSNFPPHSHPSYATTGN